MPVDVWLGDHNSMGYSCFVQCLLFGGFLPGGGFLANIYTPWMGYYGGLRFVPRSFPPGIAFRRFSFRLSKVADFLSISFAREKLFPGNFAS